MLTHWSYVFLALTHWYGPLCLPHSMAVVPTHAGRPYNSSPHLRHIWSVNWASIGSGYGLSPVRRQAITWTSAGLFWTEPLGANFSEIWIEILTFSFKNMHLKMSSAKNGSHLVQGDELTMSTVLWGWLECPGHCAGVTRMLLGNTGLCHYGRSPFLSMAEQRLIQKEKMLHMKYLLILSYAVWEEDFTYEISLQIILAIGRWYFICNNFSHWLRPRPATHRKQAPDLQHFLDTIYFWCLTVMFGSDKYWAQYMWQQNCHNDNSWFSGSASYIHT